MDFTVISQFFRSALGGIQYCYCSTPIC